MGFRETIKTVVSASGFEVRRLRADSASIRGAIQLLHSANDGSEWSRRFLSYAVRYYSLSKSQLMQDIFVLSALHEKSGGYFVEFGGGDGVTFSNSYLLEKQFGWKGIVAEPSRSFIPKLMANRRCHVDTRCVWSISQRKLTFVEVEDGGELSTVKQFKQCDHHDRSKAVEYEVDTVSLDDLLQTHDAPTEIDYLSVDTEGSELEILENVDFNRWRFNVITVEHNFVPKNRSAIFKLLTAAGYTRIATQFSEWGDWYIRA
jgi:FkbM family methyltransferase